MILIVIAIVALCLASAAIAFLSIRRAEPANTWVPLEEERSEDWEFPPRNQGSNE